ncbi:hypothetical protein QR680_002639 [Steinernema hermaphroditum]|uniref:Uncharacterized protein n=1 Tax=Steinernema hermaphroditum TaxID=289476 RepID=A0AA39H3G7_9BILA|nr:hypothetical protein QR680_002639 [Steinernema hermaphroditum]
MAWPSWLLLWVSWSIDYVDLNYFEYLFWLFLPIFVAHEIVEAYHSGCNWVSLTWLRKENAALRRRQVYLQNSGLANDLQSLLRNRSES